MIIDCFNYNGEPIAEARIAYLSPVVDLFVVVEGLYTFSGQRKPRLMERAPFRKNPKVLSVLVPGKPPRDDYCGATSPAWAAEHYQRDFPRGVVLARCAKPDDLVICSDVDEIPSRDYLQKRAAQDVAEKGPISFGMDFLYYNFGWKKPKPWPPSAFVASPKDLQARSISSFRHADKRVAVPNCGWHCSFFETPEAIKRKIEAFSHQEYNRPEFTDLDHIRACVVGGKDLFGRADEDCVPNDRSALPSELLEWEAAWAGR